MEKRKRYVRLEREREREHVTTSAVWKKFLCLTIGEVRLPLNVTQLKDMVYFAAISNFKLGFREFFFQQSNEKKNVRKIKKKSSKMYFAISNIEDKGIIRGKLIPFRRLNLNSWN